MADRDLFENLRALGAVSAPAGLRTAVLAEIGLGDTYTMLDTALGPVYVAWNQRGVCAVMKTPTAADFEARFEARFGRVAQATTAAPPMRAGRFDLRGVTEFERAVLLKALEIPAGEVRTYGWIAAEIGRPGAVRAVGSALRKNPVPVLIPCHRVVRGDGQIGNYALGGSTAKRTMLAAEGVPETRVAELARQWRGGSGRVAAAG
jgi:O-6-methylguanine DNA methyltransferase